MILRRRKPEKMGVRPETVFRSQAHMKWVRGWECLAKGHPLHACRGRMEAHHVKASKAGGTSIKPGDEWCVPACASLHAEIDAPNSSEPRVMKKYGLDFVAAAQRLAGLSPHFRRWQRSQDR